jgi:hypothetical protein
MRSKPTLQIAAALLLIFAFGAAAGVSFGRGTARRELASQALTSADLVDRFLYQKMAAYRERLQLSEAQVEQMRPAMAKSRSDLRASHERSMREVWSIMGEHYRSLNRVLTPEQRVIFEQMVEEKKEAASKQP